ncbi:MAG: carboxylating nicotinate-nucleotide diphosphorylase [Bacteroidetes bacterium]|nr:MAG: carboxylating nicotinate-nucleotide diphosphorylase [Bacteroidota bacterium]
MNVDEFIRLALEEDLGDGDHTSLSTIPEGKSGAAQLLAKQQGILAGVDVARKVFKAVDPDTALEVYLEDGTAIKAGDVVFRVSGKAISLLSAERLALNFMQRMSGIATYTHFLNSLMEGLHTKLLDTRKTTPNFRYFEKEAVRIGGGVNHRMGLYDMIMIKDNHVDFAGGIGNAIKATHQYLESKDKKLKIEIEVRNLKELREVLETRGVDRIMLDNFSIADMTAAVEMVGGKYETEASGMITEGTIRKVAETGVDFISVGALTHQVKSLDLSLKAI